MPELPEVETLVNELKPEVTGKTILNIRIFRSLPIAPLQPKAFKAMIESKKITAVTRLFALGTRLIGSTALITLVELRGCRV